ncbi:MAG TPA: glucose/sorbosone family PQQ-dependent dehydrogenase [Vicinamibacterales bacterium]|nr:glucose/sorbosone family PQQ-dependent dehydrogenase [Vicinamibacterales bacterium]
MRVIAFWFCLVGLVPIQTSLRELGVQTETPEKFSMRVITSGLWDPWEILIGPDGRLWVTVRSAHTILRIDPATGTTTTLATVTDAHHSDTQDGLLGLALHPGFMRSRGLDFAYVSFIYDIDPGPAVSRRMKLRRYTFDAATGTLGKGVDLLSDLPSSSDHSGGRLAISPDLKLILTLGDLAANQLGHQCDLNHAQDLPTADQVAAKNWTAYQGKILRINLDGSIPADNPVLAGTRSHVFSYGHRNPQGLAFGPRGDLYASEHGPSTDDELNLIKSGKNYGWPHIAGDRDDRSYVYANWSASSPAPCASLNPNSASTPSSVPQQKETDWSHPDFVAPLRTFFTVGPEYPFSQGNAVIAPSGIDVYSSTAIPGWADSVLMTSLLRSTILRVKLDQTGQAAVGPSLAYFQTQNRYRDVAISPDGRTIYVSVDNYPPKDNPGSILAFSYQGAK